METATQTNLKTAPRVYDYSDYRSFLIDHFQFKKNQNSGWSYQAWAQKLGLKNNTSLLKIIHGERHAGPDISAKLLKYLNLNTKETQYFEGLILLAKNKKNPTTQVMLMQRLQGLHPKGEFQMLDDSKFRTIASWWYYGIRQLAKRPDFELDSDWIVRQMLYPIQRREVDQALTTLKKLGLLGQNEAGQWEAKNNSLNTSDDVASEALKRFHEGVLKLASESLRKSSVKEREISGITMLVNEDDIATAKLFLRKVQDDFAALFSKKNVKGRVYQLELALFPLTKNDKKTKTDEISESTSETKFKRGNL